MGRANGKLDNFFEPGWLETWFLMDKEHGCFLTLRLKVRETSMGTHKALGMYAVILQGHSKPKWVRRLWKLKDQDMRCSGAKEITVSDEPEDPFVHMLLRHATTAPSDNSSCV